MIWSWIHRRIAGHAGRRRPAKHARSAPSLEPLEQRQLFSAAPTDIVVVSSATSLSYGQTVTLTATVSSSSTPSEGTITFEDGTSTLGNAPVSGGLAILRNVLLPIGTDLVTASYADPVGNFAASSTTLGPNSIIQTVAGDGLPALGNGDPATVAASCPVSVAVDSAGDLFIADFDSGTVREVNALNHVITAFAGGGSGGNGSPATAADLGVPDMLLLDTAGDLFIASGQANTIYEVNAVTHIVTTVAGTGQSGYSGNGGPATAAELADPAGLAFDSAGDLFIADTANNVVREINAKTGIITTVAGNGTSGYSGDGGPASAAELNYPQAVAVDTAGDLFISDSGNSRIREVNAVSHVITTVAGNGANVHPPGTTVATNIAPAVSSDAVGDGGPATAAPLDGPGEILLNSAGDLLIADTGDNRVREVNLLTGVITTVAGNGYTYTPSGVVISPSSPAGGFGGDGGPATAAALNGPGGIALDSAGNLFIADKYNYRVREVNAATQIIATVAGDGNLTVNDLGGPATAADLSSPTAVATDSAGDVFIADSTLDRVYEVNSATSLITTVAGGGSGNFGGQATAAALNGVGDIAVDSAGDVFIIEPETNQVCEVQVGTGLLTLVAGIPRTNTTAPVYPYSGEAAPANIGNGGPATAATLSYPVSVAVDSAGDLFIADSGDFQVREVNAQTGIITTAAGDGIYGFGGDGGPATAAGLDPASLAFDSAGNLFILDSSSSRVREVNAVTGIITTVAGTGTSANQSSTSDGDGGPATAATLQAPFAIALDSAGDLFVVELPDAVREVNAATGIISTISRAVPPPNTAQLAMFGGDGGPVSAAEMSDPMGIALDSAGNLFIADTDNARVREVAAGAVVSVSTNASNATPTVTVADPSGVYTSQPFAASDAVNGQASLEGVTPTLTYFSGTSTTAAPLGSAPLAAGTYTVLASFAGSADYNPAFASATFTIAKATPTVTVTASGGRWTGEPFPATVRVAGVGGQLMAGASLEGVTPGLSYYSGTATTGSPLSGAPSAAGTYTVVASFAGSTDYSPATASTTFTVANVPTTTISLQISSSPVVYGNTVTLTATVASGTTPSEGTVTFLAGTKTLGTAPVNLGIATLGKVLLPAGTYTITASYQDPTGNFDPSSTSAAPQPISIIQTVAGGGSGGSSGPATAASLSYSQGVAVDGAGDIFIADTGDNQIREVNAITHVMSVVAGSGVAGYSGDGGQATAAELAAPTAVAVDSAGDIFIVDTGNNVVREINAMTHVITTVAGNGTVAFSGDGGQATAAALDGPQGIALDSAGDIFISDSGNNRIREVNAVTHVITTVAGNGTAAFGGDGGLATAAELHDPIGIAMDSAGDIFIADSGNNRIREVNAGTQLITTVAGGVPLNYLFGGSIAGPATAATLVDPTGVALDTAGDLFLVNEGTSAIFEVTAATQMISTFAGRGLVATPFSTSQPPPDGVAGTAAELSPTAIAVDAAGNVYIGNGDTILEMTGANLEVSPAVPKLAVSDSSGPYSGAGFPATATVAGGASGVDATPAASLEGVTPTVTYYSGLYATGAALVDAPTLAGTYTVLASFAGSTDYTSASASANFEIGATSVSVAVSSSTVAEGQPVNLTATVTSTSSPSEGTVTFLDGTTTLGTAPVSGGKAVLDGVVLPVGVNAISASYTDPAGKFASSSTSLGPDSVIETVAGTGTYFGDGGPATAAVLQAPNSVAVDSAGNVFIADSANNVIREVNHVTGIITTVAGNGTAGFSGDGGQATAAALNYPAEIAVDSVGDLFILDFGNDRIREVNAVTHLITTLAGNGIAGFSGDGGPATAASLSGPDGIALDSAGDLFISDGNNDRVREVNAATHVITTIAGSGVFGFSGDGGPATAASLALPTALAVDSAGDVYICDVGNTRIREVNHATGIITTVVGTGTGGSSGDGGPATAATLYSPQGLALDSAGNLYIADASYVAASNCIREVNAITHVITTVAGNGAVASTGDGGPATAASLDEPVAIAAGAAGDLFIVQRDDNLVREVNAANHSITTIAGTDQNVEVGPATAATVEDPRAVAVDSAGDVLIVDGNVIREVNAVTQAITTVAGNGSSGYTGDGGPATAVGLNSPWSIAVDSAGDLFIADTYDNRILEVNAVTHLITTVAGNGTQGFSGDGGPATAASLSDPEGIAMDSAGDLFIADSGNNRVRELNAITHTITTIAGDTGSTVGAIPSAGPATAVMLGGPTAVAVDSAGDVFIANSAGWVSEINAATQLVSTVAGTGSGLDGGNGGPATAATLYDPVDIAVDTAGDVFIAESSGAVRTVNAATGTISGLVQAADLPSGVVVMGPQIPAPDGIALDSAGDLVFVNLASERVQELLSGSAVVDVTSAAIHSSVAPLPPRTSETSFPVSWSGTDSAGPITGYNISVSVNGGPFAPWLKNTTLTSATYNGTIGDTYGFISQAYDAAGNTETAHTTADTTVTVTATPWQNPKNSLDVIGSGGAVVPADALAVINYLDAHGSQSALPPNFAAGSDYLDVLGTGTVTPADALAIINYLDQHSSGTSTASTQQPASIAAAVTSTQADTSGLSNAAATAENDLEPATPSTPASEPAASNLLSPSSPVSAAGLGSVSPAVMAIVSPAGGGNAAVDGGADMPAVLPMNAAPSGAGSSMGAGAPAAAAAATEAVDTLFEDAPSDWWNG